MGYTDTFSSAEHKERCGYAVSGIFNLCFVDFGVSSVISDYGDRSRPKVRKTFVGTPCWMAPEVMEQVRVIKYYMYMYSYPLATVEHCNIEADIYEVFFCWDRCRCACMQ